VPTWVWWLVGLLVAGAALTWFLVSRARRRSALRAELHVAEAEVAWLARDLLPRMRSTGSLQQALGAWEVTRERAAAAEDRLTVLVSSLQEPADVERATTLRDAVRDATQRIGQLSSLGPDDTWVLDLDEVIAGLETALARPA